MRVRSLPSILTLIIITVSSQAASIPENGNLALARRDPLIIVPDGSVAPDWKYAGCFNDCVYERVLQPKIYKTDTMTQELCIQYCITAGYWYAGVEFGRECYCGDLIRTGDGIKGIAQAESQCSTPCAGNAKEKCGGKSLLNVFTNGRKATINPGVNGFTSIGCKSDAGGNFRTLTTTTNLPANNMTVAACTSACAAANFIFAGVENGKECYCGNSLTSGTDTYDGLRFQDACDIPCTGNQSEWCGGSASLNVYKRPLTLPKPPPLPQGWYPQDCMYDDVNSRTLSKFLGLPQETMTVETCVSACAQRGYIYAGLEYAQECYCGNTLNPNAGTPDRGRNPCNLACRGNTAEICGGRGTLNVYKYANQSAVNQLRNSGFEDGAFDGADYWGVDYLAPSKGNLSTTIETGSGNALTGRRNALIREIGTGDSGFRDICFTQYIPHLDYGWYNLTFYVGRVHTSQQPEYYDTIRYLPDVANARPLEVSFPLCSPPSACPYRPVSGSKLAGYDKVTYYLYTLGGTPAVVEICGIYYDTRKNPQDGMLLDEVTLVGPL